MTNCIKCKHHEVLSWSKLSKCNHPEVDSDEQKALMSEAVGIGLDFKAKRKLCIKRGPSTNVRFIWPYRFDPDQVRSCKGFEE